MLVLGIDPGIAITGYGLILQESNGSIKVIDFGVLITDKQLAVPARLLILYQQISELMLLHKPDCCAVEKLFFQKNVKTAMTVGEARGVVLLAIAQNNLVPSEYTPNEIKQAVAGYGSADKKQVQQMVQRLLNLPMIPKPDDAADALAVALCHLNQSKFFDAVSRALDT